MGQYQGSTVVEEAAAHSECRHHWFIESPAGPFSKGVCRRCGLEREFKNYLEELRWEDRSGERASSTERYVTLRRDPVEADEDA